MLPEPVPVELKPSLQLSRLQAEADEVLDHVQSCSLGRRGPGPASREAVLQILQGRCSEVTPPNSQPFQHGISEGGADRVDRLFPKPLLAEEAQLDEPPEPGFEVQLARSREAPRPLLPPRSEEDLGEEPRCHRP